MASTNLRDAHETLRDAFIEVRTQYEEAYPDHSLIVTCTYRTPAEQTSLYAKGRSQPGQIVTQRDGVTTLSRHNVFPSQAIDFAVCIAGKVSWQIEEYAVPGHLAEALGLVWGGSWPHFQDVPHLELPEVA